MSLDDLVIDIGSRVQTLGRVEVIGDGVWLAPIRPSRKGRPNARFDRAAVRLTGLSRSPNRRSPVHGHRAAVVGTWGGVNTISRAEFVPRREVPSGADRPYVARSEVPGPRPPSGWPRAAGDAIVYDAGDLFLTGKAIRGTVVRPDRDSQVLVISAADPQAVHAVLDPQLGDALCVVASKWTRHQLDGARNALLDSAFDLGLLSVGEGTDANFQPEIRATIRYLDPAIVSDIRLLGEIVHLSVWIQPLGEADH